MTYWDKTLSERLSRRRALTGLGAVTSSAAFLLACGSDDEPQGGSGATSGTTSGGSAGTGSSGGDSGLVSEQVDTLASATRGGTLKISINSDVRSFEPYLRDSTVNTHTWLAQMFLVRQEPTPFALGSPDAVVPDGAQSWEYSPDKLTLTFKLQPNAKWDSRPPTNGRQVVADDVVYSWEKFVEVSSIRQELANSISPSAPIVSVSAPDAQTVVMNLAFPQAELLSQFRDYSAATLLITPPENEQGFDAKTDTRGAGPFFLSEYVPSSRLVYERNPGHWDTSAPYIDRIEMPIISEYASALAQLRSGGIYYYASGSGVQAEDLVQTKTDIPDLRMVPEDVIGINRFLFFGQVPESPFTDVRVRRAFMRAIDREIWIDTFYNVSQLSSQGLPIDTAWNTCANCSWTDYWLDPRGSEFGEWAQNFEFNLEEAKKLLDAAGYSDGLDIESPRLVTGQYGASFPTETEVILNMAGEAGFRATTIPIDFNTEWRPKIADALGQFNGVSAQLASSSSRIWLWALLNSKGSFFKGFDADGSSSYAGDPMLDEATTRLLQEFDQDEAFRLAHEIQRRDAEMVYSPMYPGGATTYELAWPVVGNFGVYRQDRWLKKIYVDSSKAPLAQ